MALTELSFAPLPTQVAPPAAPLPTPASPGLVSNVLPPGSVARSGSPGGRWPLIALVIVLLLGGAGAAYSTGVLGGNKDKPQPVVPQKKSAAKAVVSPAAKAVAPAKPAAKPAAKKPVAKKPAVPALAGATVTLTKANSGTLGGDYSFTVPTGWRTTLNAGADGPTNRDFEMHTPDRAFSIFSGVQVQPGPVAAETLDNMKAAVVDQMPSAKVLPGSLTMSVGGLIADGYDLTATVDGQTIKLRTIVVAHNGVAYGFLWAAPKESFAASLPKFGQILASVQFVR
jgi:hypothetical protein